MSIQIEQLEDEPVEGARCRVMIALAVSIVAEDAKGAVANAFNRLVNDICAGEQKGQAFVTEVMRRLDRVEIVPHGATDEDDEDEEEDEDDD